MLAAKCKPYHNWRLIQSSWNPLEKKPRINKRQKNEREEDGFLDLKFQKIKDAEKIRETRNWKKEHDSHPTYLNN